jgi:hypothetical protein
MDLETVKQLVSEFGAMGILGYGIIRALKMAERITDSIVGAFENQTQKLRDVHAALEALENTMHSHAKALNRRIGEAESNIIQTTSGSSPRIPRVERSM